MFDGFDAADLYERHDRLSAPIRKWSAASSAAWLSADSSHVARRGAIACSEVQCHLRRSPGLWAKRLPGFEAGSRFLFKADNGIRHDCGDGEAGVPQLSVAGHDRGGRVAYRMALDHPDRVTKAAVLDVVPTSEAWNRADADFAFGFWPWSLLAQAEPLLERILTAAAEPIRSAYAEVLRDPDHAHAICEEYRAAATLDRDHDEADRKAGRRIACPVLVLWSGKGPLHSWYDTEGGPVGIWKKWAENVQGAALAGGHFFPEELPGETADHLAGFFR